MADRLCYVVPREKLVSPPQHWPFSQDSQNYRRGSAKYVSRQLRQVFARRSTTPAKQLGQPGQHSVGSNAASLAYFSGYLVLPDLLTRPEDRAVGNWGENPDVPHGGIA